LEPPILVEVVADLEQLVLLLQVMEATVVPVSSSSDTLHKNINN
jgi:hypothetical protein